MSFDLSLPGRGPLNWWGTHATAYVAHQWRSEGYRRPGAMYLDSAPGEISDSFSLRHKKIASYPSKFLMTFFFSHRPIFLGQSLQHTGFAPLFTQLTNEAPHFAPPLQFVLHKFLFSALFTQFCTPIFVNYYEKALKILFGHRFYAHPP